jgi:hypothetical protein
MATGSVVVEQASGPSVVAAKAKPAPESVSEATKAVEKDASANDDAGNDQDTLPDLDDELYEEILDEVEAFEYSDNGETSLYCTVLYFLEWQLTTCYRRGYMYRRGSASSAAATTRCWHQSVRHGEHHERENDGAQAVHRIWRQDTQLS